VNATEVASQALTRTLATSASAHPLQIGGDSVYTQFSSGTIAEVMYNIALTQAQIQLDLNTPLP
jgi:hypothetical protein